MKRSSDSNVVLTEHNLSELCRLLHRTRRSWRPLGLELGLQVSDLENIDGQDNKENLEQMLLLWLRRPSLRPSWATLVAALKSSTVDREDVGCEIERKQVLTPQFQGSLLEGVRPTGTRLGQGAFGSVEEVDVGGLICAGKRIREDLVNGSGEAISQRYKVECQLMADLRHPHIVQFLGLCFLEGSSLPVLVMEKLVTNLKQQLERTPRIPTSFKQSILVDVATALVYLHNHKPNTIIHRDLSATNVLLNSAMVAKISDLGNSRVIDLQPGQLARTLTRFPGTAVYMPPEAMTNKPRYGPSLDVFSFGHLSLFTLTQVPCEDLLPSNYPDPENPRHLIPLTEVQRRGTFFAHLYQQLGERHPLVQLVERCLDNIPEFRPSAVDVLVQLQTLKIEDQYEHLTRADVIQLLQQRAGPKREEEIQRLQTQQQMQDYTVCLSSSCQYQWLIPRRLSGAKHFMLEVETLLSMTTPSPSSCIYDFELDSWCTIRTPKCFYALATYCGQLVLAGGSTSFPLIPTNQLWLKVTQQHHFLETIPPMGIPTRSGTAIGIEHILIVAGGYDGRKYLNVVQIYDGRLWSLAQTLPKPSSHMKYAIHNDTLYLIGGSNQDRKVFYIHQNALFLSSSPQQANELNPTSTWNTLTDAPLELSCLAVLGSELVAIGGGAYSSPSSSLHVYSWQTHSWVELDAVLPKPLTGLCSITLPTGELIVIGGWESEFGNYSPQVHRVTIVK